MHTGERTRHEGRLATEIICHRALDARGPPQLFHRGKRQLIRRNVAAEVHDELRCEIDLLQLALWLAQPERHHQSGLVGLLEHMGGARLDLFSEGVVEEGERRSVAARIRWGTPIEERERGPRADAPDQRGAPAPILRHAAPRRDVLDELEMDGVGGKRVGRDRRDAPEHHRRRDWNGEVPILDVRGSHLRLHGRGQRGGHLLAPCMGSGWEEHGDGQHGDEPSPAGGLQERPPWTADHLGILGCVFRPHMISFGAPRSRRRQLEMLTGSIPVETVQPEARGSERVCRGAAEHHVAPRGRDLAPPQGLYFLAAQDSATTQPTNVQPKTVLTTAIDAILRLSRWYAMTVGSMYQNTNNTRLSSSIAPKMTPPTVPPTRREPKDVTAIKTDILTKSQIMRASGIRRKSAEVFTLSSHPNIPDVFFDRAAVLPSASCPSAISSWIAATGGSRC